MSPRARFQERAALGPRVSLLLGIVACGSIAASGLPQSTARAASTQLLQQNDEDTVKAAFVYNFAARHVKWPESAHRDKSSPFVIGVLGKGALFASIESICRGRKSGERAIVVRAVESADDALLCHVLVVLGGRERELDEIVAATRGRPLLIVGSAEPAISHGAHIAFYVERSKVRFAIAPERARSAQLEISSELLKLARIVAKHEERAQ